MLLHPPFFEFLRHISSGFFFKILAALFKFISLCYFVNFPRRIIHFLAIREVLRPDIISKTALINMQENSYIHPHRFWIFKRTLSNFKRFREGRCQHFQAQRLSMLLLKQRQNFPTQRFSVKGFWLLSQWLDFPVPFTLD